MHIWCSIYGIGTVYVAVFMITKHTLFDSVEVFERQAVD